MIKNIIFKNYLLITVTFLFLIINNNICYPNIYTVDNFEYIAKYSDIKKNRQTILEKIKKASFSKLLKKILLKDDFSRIKIDNNYSEYIKSFSIQDEIKKNNDYLFSSKTVFEPNKIKQFLESKNLRYVDYQSRPILLLFVTKKDKINILNEEDDIVKEWNKKKEENLTTFAYPSNDLKDIEILKEIDFKYYELADIEKLTRNYGLSSYLLVFIDYDKKNDNVFIKFSSNQIKFLKKYNLDSKISDTSYLSLFTKIKDDVDFAWKELQILSPKKKNIYTFVYQVKNLEDLLDFKNIIKNFKDTNNVRDIMVSSKYYRGEIVFNGSEESLVSEFNKVKLNVQKSENLWLIKK